MKKTNVAGLVLRAVELLVTLAVAAAIIMAVVNIKSGQGEQGREQLETSLRRSAMACYAIEGVYPPSVEYLQQRYGVQIDEERYLVSYSAFAENLMPDITVLVR